MISWFFGLIVLTLGVLVPLGLQASRHHMLGFGSQR